MQAQVNGTLAHPYTIMLQQQTQHHGGVMGPQNSGNATMMTQPVSVPLQSMIAQPHYSQTGGRIFTQINAVQGQHFVTVAGQQRMVGEMRDQLPYASGLQQATPQVPQHVFQQMHHPLFSCQPVPSALPPPPMNPTPPVYKDDKDDHQKLSTSYRILGMQWQYGPRSVIPKKVKSSCIMRWNPVEWTVFRFSVIDDDELDCLLFVLTGIKPTTRIADLAVRTKGELRKTIADEAARVHAAQPERSTGLAHDLSNVIVEAIRLGYKVEYLPEHRRNAILMSSPVTMMPGPLLGPTGSQQQQRLHQHRNCSSSSSHARLRPLFCPRSNMRASRPGSRTSWMRALRGAASRRVGHRQWPTQLVPRPKL